MEKLKYYEAVNSAETEEDLKKVILSFGETIEGRSKFFSTKQMAKNLELYMQDMAPANTLTRNYGIRQQVMMIKSWR